MMVEILTNGSRLAAPRNLALLTRLKPNRITLSLYGATAESYDALTRRRGAYRMFVRGLDAAHEAGLPRAGPVRRPAGRPVRGDGAALGGVAVHVARPPILPRRTVQVGEKPFIATRAACSTILMPASSVVQPFSRTAIR